MMARQTLIVVDMAREHHVGIAAGLVGGSVEHLAHMAAAGVMVVRGIQRMM
jgi:hypothetical protein